MTFTDHGIALCFCGTERRVYAPESDSDARLCLPCIQARFKPYADLFDRPEDRERSKSMRRVRSEVALRQNADHQRERRAQLRAAGICWTCRRSKAERGYPQCKPCRVKKANWMRRYKAERRAAD